MPPIGHPQAPDPPSPEGPDRRELDPHYEPGSLDSFPRDEITALVSQAEAGRARREAFQAWALGAGLALVALGLPTERLWGSGRIVSQVAGEGPSAFGLVVPIASALHHLAGFAPERALYLVAAISYGLLLPALRGLLRTIGFPHGLSLAAATAVVLGPGIWTAATLPLGFLPGVLGATLLAESLFRTQQRTKQGYQWRASIFSLLAFLLGPENLLLVPAAAWAVTLHPTAKALPRLLPAFNLVLVLGVALVVLMTSPGGSLHKWNALLESLLAGGSMDPASKLRWVLWMPAFLGAAAFGLWALAWGKRAPEESPPPHWVYAWCLVALVPLLGGSLSYGPVAGFLVPMAAVGLADSLMRMEREERVLPIAMTLVIVQLIAAFGTSGYLRWTDPLGEFRGVARASLNPTDHVVAADPDHRYLLRRRWGLSVSAPDEDFGAQPRAGSTVVWVRWDARDGPIDLPAVEGAQVFALTRNGLQPERP